MLGGLLGSHFCRWAVEWNSVSMDPAGGVQTVCSEPMLSLFGGFVSFGMFVSWLGLVGLYGF